MAKMDGTKRDELKEMLADEIEERRTIADHNCYGAGYSDGVIHILRELLADEK